MKKKWITMFVAACAIALVAGCSSETDEGLYPWKIDGNVLVKYEGTDKNVTIPAEVKEIGDYAFRGHPRLKSLTVHDCVTKIGESAFWDCFIETVRYEGTLAQWLSMDDCGDLMAAAGSMIITDVYEVKYRSGLVIPNGVTCISNGAFRGCQFRDVTIPDSVVSIGDYAFKDCQSIATVKIPDSVKSIGYFAFEHTSLLTLDIPGSVTSIGYSAFMSCDELASVTIAPGVTTIRERTFSGCTSLESVNYNGTKDDWRNIKKLEDIFRNTKVTEIIGNSGTFTVDKDGNITE